MGGYALLEWLLVNCSRRKMVSEVYAGLSDMTEPASSLCYLLALN